MSEVTTSGETTVAPAETVSAPPAAVPTFGNSRGSGLARGKRPSASALATSKEAASSNYQPTSIQVVNHQREYKNPFAPEPTPEAKETAKVEQPVTNTPAVQATIATPVATPVSVPTNTPAPQAVVETKAELKILPPEEKARPAQSWEIGNQSAQPTASTNNAPRREGRPDFRSERRERQDREGRPEQRGEFRPRERRDQGGERREQFSEPRREQRTFEPKPTPAVAEAKKSGFLNWLKGLFGGDSTEQTQAKPTQSQDQRPGEDRRHDGGGRGGRPHHRGGRGHGGYRGDNRGENRGTQFGSNLEGQGQSQGGEHGNSDRRFDGGNRGGGRRHHRGGRGRFRGDNRGGEQRSDNGPAS